MQRVIQVLTVCGMLAWLLVAAPPARAQASEVLKETVTLSNVDAGTRATITGSFVKKHPDDTPKLNAHLKIDGRDEALVRNEYMVDAKGTLNFRVDLDFSRFIESGEKGLHAKLNIGSTKLGTFKNLKVTRNDAK